MQTTDTVLFREVQRFPLWLSALSLVPPVVVFYVLAPGVYLQFTQGIPFGNNPVGNGPLIVILVVLFLVIFMTTGLMLATRLVTEVRSDALYVRFFPFHLFSWKRFSYDAIQSCQAVTYRPIMEYGGWGLRYSIKRGWIYNIRGNKGVKLLHGKGENLLIGSQQAEELAAVITAQMIKK